MTAKKVTALVVGVVAVAAFVTASVAFAQSGGNDKDDLGKVRSATAAFHRTDAAEAAGWNLQPGLDGCFDNQPVGGMGFHYINPALLRNIAEIPEAPEALVYAPGPNGQRNLAAVEWIVPAALWDAAGKTSPPELFGRKFALDTTLGVYELHAWVFQDNPSGTFEDWNPRVSCPVS